MSTGAESQTPEVVLDGEPVIPGRACPHCPWLIGNQGRRHPDGWYTARNRERLWAELRRGEDMSCHPTDPANPVSEAAAAAGYRAAPPGSRKRECVGAAILKQREMMTFQERFGGNPKRYRRERPRGLTMDGIRELVWRYVTRNTGLGPRLPMPDLNDERVQHPPLGRWPEGVVESES